MLDTNILIDWLKWQRKSRLKNDRQKYYSESAKELIAEQISTNNIIYISCHTIKELLQYPNISSQEENRILTMLPQFTIVLDTTLEIAKIAGYLSRQSAEYRKHHIEDCYIAATAITYKLILYTRNPDDFKYVEHTGLIVAVPYQYQPSVNRD